MMIRCFFCLFVCLFVFLFTAALVAYGASQARGRIRVTAAGPAMQDAKCVLPISQLTAAPDP